MQTRAGCGEDQRQTSRKRAHRLRPPLSTTNDLAHRTPCCHQGHEEEEEKKKKSSKGGIRAKKKREQQQYR